MAMVVVTVAVVAVVFGTVVAIVINTTNPQLLLEKKLAAIVFTINSFRW